MKISVIIPNYNGEDILKNNFPKLFDVVSSSGFDSEIIISDDSSSDSSTEIVKKFIDKYKGHKTKIKLLTASVNKGFSSNVNRAVRESSGEILILLNTDVVPGSDFLEPLINHFEDESVFAVGCMDESIEGEKTVLRGRGEGSWIRGFLVHSAAPIEGVSTLWVSGGSGAFRKSIWEKLGGMDPLYNPFYWEDIDLSYRAIKSGYKILFENKSIVRHEHEKGIIKKSYNKKKVLETAYRNQFIFAWKNSDSDNLVSNVFWLPYHLVKALFSGDKSLIIGFLKALGLLPKIINSRKNVRKFFIKSDREVTNLA